jgi:hypothetical protein
VAKGGVEGGPIEATEVLDPAAQDGGSCRLRSAGNDLAGFVPQKFPGGCFDDENDQFFTGAGGSDRPLDGGSSVGRYSSSWARQGRRVGGLGQPLWRGVPVTAPP